MAGYPSHQTPALSPWNTVQQRDLQVETNLLVGARGFCMGLRNRYDDPNLSSIPAGPPSQSSQRGVGGRGGELQP